MNNIQENIADVVGISLSGAELTDNIIDVVGMSDFEQDLNGVSPDMEDALLQHILKTRNVIATSPRLIENQQDSTQMLQMYNYLIENWNDIQTRVVAIKILAMQEKELVKKGYINYNFSDLEISDTAEFSGFFSVLAELYKDEINELSGLDGFWSKIKEKVKKVSKGVIKLHKKVFDAHKKVFKKVVDIHKKGFKKFKKILPVINKFNPLTIAVRNAFRGLLAINFLGMASILGQKDTKGVLSKVEKLYHFMGGKKSKLCSAIKKGAKKKALFNKKYQRQLEKSKSKKLKGIEDDDYNYDNYGENQDFGTLGEPFTIGAMLTAAGGFLLKVWDWIKKAGLKAKSLTHKITKYIEPKSKWNNESFKTGDNANNNLLTQQNNKDFQQKQNDNSGTFKKNLPQKSNENKENKWKKPLIIGTSIFGALALFYGAYKLSNKDKDAPKSKLAGISLQ